MGDTTFLNILVNRNLNHSGSKKTYPPQFINLKLCIKRFNSYIRFRDYRISHGLFHILFKNAKNYDIFNSQAFRSYQEESLLKSNSYKVRFINSK